MLGSSTPRGLNLQNLAWLGEDGQVHTVNDNANTNANSMGRPLRGATRPLLGSANNFATVDSMDTPLRGATRP